MDEHLFLVAVVKATLGISNGSMLYPPGSKVVAFSDKALPQPGRLSWKPAVNLAHG